MSKGKRKKGKKELAAKGKEVEDVVRCWIT